MFAVIAGLLALTGQGYFVNKHIEKLAEIEKLKSDLNQKINENEKLSLNLNAINIILSSTTKSKEILESRLSDLGKNFETTLEVTQKIQERASFDSELLKKYSRTYFLNENYKPEFLFEVDQAYTNGKSIQLLPIAKEKLEEMLSTASTTGLDIKVLSGYRSFTEQSSLKNAYKVRYGSGANAFSADQGYSEHQLGTAVDLIKGENPLSQSFDTTEEFKWLKDNAHKYGFVLSYPKGNPYYIYEPWHFRYVGVTLATFLYNSNQSFNNIDQRILDAYVDYWKE